MKKLIFAAGLIALLGLAACSKKDESPPSPQATTPPSTATTPPATSTTPSDSSGQATQPGQTQAQAADRSQNPQH